MIKELERLGAEHRLRAIPAEREGALLDLCSNDYLGLSTLAPQYMAEFRERFGDAPMSASASRLLASRQRHFNAYEEYLASLYGKEAILFNSGYHANTGIMSALGALPGTVIIADKLIHASAIDGMRLAGCEWRRFRHNDPAHLRATIRKALEGRDVKRVVVAVESVYSMDGDRAPLREIVDIKRVFPETILFVDEAHGFGVLGERGLGAAEEEGLIPEIDIIMATLGKAAASSGAFAICDTTMKSWLINASRSLIFSTALPPANVCWSHLMTEKITEACSLRENLRSVCADFAKRMKDATGQPPVSNGHIQPLLTGDAARALSLSASLREAGYDVLAIRRPTVPPGGERLRFSLNAMLRPGQLDSLFETLISSQP
ncbi:MAG: 8-amino-7-oxononanoate synthase [Bacteroides sp.]|nr:8-amino-7-oxononanoate synthase [Bacteroides sp.]